MDKPKFPGGLFGHNLQGGDLEVSQGQRGEGAHHPAHLNLLVNLTLYDLLNADHRGQVIGPSGSWGGAKILNL